LNDSQPNNPNPNNPDHLNPDYLTPDHLTPDQFAAFALAGSPDSSAVHAVAVDLEAGIDPAGLAHLAACALCREDLARFTDSLASFNTLSLAWAESRPARPIVFHSTLHKHWLPRAAWAFAACLLILSLFALSPPLNRDEPELASALHPTTNPDSPAEIDRDNRLMNQVTLEINRPVRSPAAEYGLTPQPESAHPSRSHPSLLHPSLTQKTPAESRLD